MLDLWSIRGICCDANRRQESNRGEETKVDLIVRKMRRYDMKVIGLQETKWFGCDVYDVA